MKIHDVNPTQEKVVILLHPMLANARLMRELLAEPMGEHYRYLIPDFSGHGDAVGTDYECAEKEAEQLAVYLNDQKIHSVALAFGASMGATILMELLQCSNVRFEQLFFEGASMYTHAGVLNVLIRRIMKMKRSKARAHPEIVAPKMGKLYGERVKDIMAEQMLSISERSLVNIVHDCAFVRLPVLTAEQQKRCVFAYGERDADLKLARRICPKQYPQAQLKIWPGKGHCTSITEEPNQYAAMLKDLAEGLELR